MNVKHLTMPSLTYTWLESGPSILKENLGPELNDSDQTNESDEGECSENDSGNSPSPKGKTEGENYPSLEGEPEEANNLNPGGARPIRTQMPNPR